MLCYGVFRGHPAEREAWVRLFSPRVGRSCGTRLMRVERRQELRVRQRREAALQGGEAGSGRDAILPSDGGGVVIGGAGGWV